MPSPDEPLFCWATPLPRKAMAWGPGATAIRRCRLCSEPYTYTYTHTHTCVHAYMRTCLYPFTYTVNRYAALSVQRCRQVLGSLPRWLRTAPEFSKGSGTEASIGRCNTWVLASDKGADWFFQFSRGKGLRA